MDSQDTTLRQWLDARFTAIEDRLDEQQRTAEKRLDHLDRVLISGNGQPALTYRVAKAEERLDTVDDLLAYDRQQIDSMRGVTKTSGRWGAMAGGVVSLITAVVLAISEAVTRKQ